MNCWQQYGCKCLHSDRQYFLHTCIQMYTSNEKLYWCYSITCRPVSVMQRNWNTVPTPPLQLLHLDCWCSYAYIHADLLNCWNYTCSYLYTCLLVQSFVTAPGVHMSSPQVLQAVQVWSASERAHRSLPFQTLQHTSQWWLHQIQDFPATGACSLAVHLLWHRENSYANCIWNKSKIGTVNYIDSWVFQ